MGDQVKKMSLDEAAAAVGQMENFFKAFRRVSDVVAFLRTADQRTRELTDAIGKLEADLAAKADEHTQAMTAQSEALAAIKKKIDRAEAALRGIEEAANEQTAAAEAKVKAIKDKAAEAAAEAKAAQEAADAHLAETLAEAEEAEGRVAKAKEQLAAMMAAGG